MAYHILLRSSNTMFKLLAAILLTVSTVNVHSQCTGYLGKRFLLQYDLAAFPAFSRPTNKSLPQQNRTFSSKGFNSQHSIGAEYILSNYWSLGSSVSFLNTKFDNNSRFRYLYYEELGPYDEMSESLIEDHKYEYSFAGLHATTLGADATLFLSGINPIGVYLKMGIFRTNYKIRDIQFQSPNTDDGSSTLRMTDESASGVFVDDKYHCYGFNLELGKRKIYFNRISFRYGFRMGTVFQSRLNDANFDVGNVVFYTANNRLKYQQAFNFTAGIGYLLF